jgi:hypothetical protein
MPPRVRAIPTYCNLFQPIYAPSPRGGGPRIETRPPEVKLSPSQVKASPGKSNLVQHFFPQKKIVYFFGREGNDGQRADALNLNQRLVADLTGQKQTDWAGKLNKKYERRETTLLCFNRYLPAPQIILMNYLTFLSLIADLMSWAVYQRTLHNAEGLAKYSDVN